MATIYDRADIYDLLESEERSAAYQKHWERVLGGTGVRSLLDVSIGSGGVTLPLGALGVELSGSDLSETMLERCGRKAAAQGLPVELRQSDFRNLSCWAGKTFDCVASTGNSLAYVTNEEIPGVLAQMDALVKPGGYLYFDTRNWDRILRERRRFYLYNPFFHGEDRINLVQVWDYERDGSMTFHLLYTFERDNQIFQKEKFEEHYHPIPRRLLLDALAGLGYCDVKQFPFPATAEGDPEQAEWYCVLARKGARSMDIILTPMTRPLCHEYFRGFESDPDIFMDMGLFTPYEYVPERVDRYFEKQQSPDRSMFLIMLDGKPVGEVGFKHIDRMKKECELTIHLQNDGVKNRGIGTAAERLALNYAFDVLGMETVNADAVLKNKRSQRVLEKVGFTFVREDDTFRYYVRRRI